MKRFDMDLIKRLQIINSGLRYGDRRKIADKLGIPLEEVYSALKRGTDNMDIIHEAFTLYKENMRKLQEATTLINE